jgi:hypothetical protein
MSKRHPTAHPYITYIQAALQKFPLQIQGAESVQLR